MRAVVILFWLLLLTSCGAPDAYQQTIQNWYGKSAQALTARWGIPNQKIVLADGKSYYVYTTQTSPYFPSPATTNAVFVVKKTGRTFAATVPTNEPQPEPLLCVTTFLMNKQQVIVKAWYEGGSCLQGAPE